MIDPILMFKQGGPLMYVILLFAMGAMVTPLAAGVFASSKIRFPAGVWWAAPVAILALGALGTSMGLTVAHEAVQHASPETKGAMAANGISVAMLTSAGARLAAGPALVWLGIFLALGTAARTMLSKQERPLQIGAAGVVAGAWLLGTVGAFASTLAFSDLGPTVFFGPTAVAIGGFALVLPALKGPPEDDVEERARLAAGRLAAGLAVVVGAAVCAWVAVVMGEIVTFSAMAKASAETKQALMQYGLQVAATGRWMVLISAGCALLPAAALCRDVRYASDTRGLVSTALGAAMCLGLLAIYSLAGSSRSGLESLLTMSP